MIITYAFIGLVIAYAGLVRVKEFPAEMVFVLMVMWLPLLVAYLVLGRPSATRFRPSDRAASRLAGSRINRAQGES